MGRHVNKRELAEILGKSERALTDWQADGMPVDGRGDRGEANEYDTEKVIAWLVAREVRKVSGAETSKDRLARLQADRVEIDIKERLRQLVPVEEIEPAWTGRVLAARSFLRAEPDRLAHMLEATEGVDAKRDLIAESFDEFLRKFAADESDDDELELDGDGAGARASAQGYAQAGASAEDDGSAMV